MSTLIECVPNFSEARRPEVVQAIVAAITSGTGVRLLDVSADTDHNRTVVTFVGSAASVLAGAFAGIATAAALIDLEQHTGAHPRIGATDVVPFIPLRQASMHDCIALAHQLGQRVGDELGIPVYLYEAAATRPDRQNLERIRRGQYERLKDDISRDPERRPDFGPCRLGPAGATVIGARSFLIAYNIYLNTADVSIAQHIARAVRHSSGGLRYVKALGLLVGGQAQVSLNLTDFRRTSVPRVVEMVRREAARYGASLLRSELVGLIPQAALVETARWYVQLDGLKDEQILEHRLATLEPAQPVEASGLLLLEALASETTAADGAAAAAYTGAMAAALVAMAARLCLGTQAGADGASAMQDTLSTVVHLRSALQASVAQDIDALHAVIQAHRLPQDTEAAVLARTTAIEPALYAAAAVALRVAQLATQVLRLALSVAESATSRALAATGSAAHLALAAVRTAACNVRVYTAAVADRAVVSQWQETSASLEQQASSMAETIQRHLDSRQST